MIFKIQKTHAEMQHATIYFSSLMHLGKSSIQIEHPDLKCSEPDMLQNSGFFIILENLHIYDEIYWRQYSNLDMKFVSYTPQKQLEENAT